MVSSITKGIQVSVETTYQPDFSNPQQHHYVFTYKVRIDNKSNHTVQLLRRRWEIFDAAESRKIVEGEGVINMSVLTPIGMSLCLELPAKFP